jgi:hypothetical protein
MMPILKKFPPLIQDIELLVKSQKVVKFQGFSDQVSSGVTLELQPQINYDIQTYSQNGFDQTLKPLQRVDIQHPKIIRFVKTFSAPHTSAEPKDVKFTCQHGPPDYVFVRAERISGAGEFFDKYPPVIEYMRLRMYNQNVETVSQLDDIQLWNATRRNSNFRSDVAKNRDEIGAVFLSAQDFGNWSRFAEFESVDNFEGTFEFFVAERPRTKPVLGVAETTLAEAQDYKITVLFIYENFALSGTAHDLKFWFQ